MVAGNAARIAETLKKVEAAGFAEVILYFNVGMKPHQQVKDEIAEGYDIRPTIAVTKAHIDMPEVRQATAAGPAHCRRVGMNVGAAAIFPDAGVRREGELCRLGTERFQ